MVRIYSEIIISLIIGYKMKRMMVKCCKLLLIIFIVEWFLNISIIFNNVNKIKYY